MLAPWGFAPLSVRWTIVFTWFVESRRHVSKAFWLDKSGDLTAPIFHRGSFGSKEMRQLSAFGWLPVGVLAVTFCSQATADLVTWNIDSTQSFIRLNLQDASGTIEVDLGSPVGVRPIDVTYSVRDADSSSDWTDAGGRRSAVSGTIATNYDEVSGTLTYLSGFHDMIAEQSGTFRPNPASFSGGSYTNTSGAAAAFAGKLRGVGSGSTGNPGLPINMDADLAFFALRNISYNSDGTLALAGGNGNFTGSGGTFGLQAGQADVDNIGFSVQVVGFLQPTAIGPVAPDDLAAPLSGFSALNSGGLSIVNLGGLDRRMTQLINTELQLSIGGVTFNGTMEGQIVAFGQAVPEPTSAGLLAVALCMGTLRRRGRLS
jgi:hypothetical protein